MDRAQQQVPVSAGRGNPWRWLLAPAVVVVGLWAMKPATQAFDGWFDLRGPDRAAAGQRDTPGRGDVRSGVTGSGSAASGSREASGPDLIVLGTSMTAAAVAPEALAGDLAKTLGRRVTVRSFARPGSTIVQHLFGVRKLLKQDPAYLRGTTVLVEAPAGRPSWATWSTPWHIPGTTEFVVSLMQNDDLVRLWSSDAPIAHRWSITSAYVTRGYDEWTQRRSIRDHVFRRGTGLADALLRGVLPARRRATPKGPSIHAAAGVGTSGAELARARGEVERELEAARASDPPVTEWGETVFRDLVALVRANGGEVAVFTLPVSSAQSRVLETPNRRAIARAFVPFARDLGIERLEVPFTVGRDDFPDLRHLAVTRRLDFTRALAKTLAAAVRSGAVGERLSQGPGAAPR
jgi:hypothetical protein